MKSFRPLLVLFFAWSLPMLALAATAIQDPTGLGTISRFIEKTLMAMVRIGSVVVALFILIAGYMFAAARGNPGKLSEAKENFVYVFIGALLILGAWVIATVIGGTVNQILS